MKRFAVGLSLLALVSCQFGPDMDVEDTIDYSGSWSYSHDVCTGLGSFLCDKETANQEQYVQFKNRNEVIVYSFGSPALLPFPLSNSEIYDSGKYYKHTVMLKEGYGVKYTVVQGVQYYFDFDGKTMFFAERSNPPEILVRDGKTDYLRGVMKRGYTKTGSIRFPDDWPRDSVEFRIE